jgi:hypothetical protein
LCYWGDTVVTTLHNATRTHLLTSTVYRGLQAVQVGGTSM